MRYLLMIFIRYDCLLAVELIDKEFDLRGAGGEVWVVAVGDRGQAWQVETGDTGQGQGQASQDPAPHNYNVYI